MSRTALKTLSLTGPHKAIRSTIFLVIAVAAAVTAIGYILPAHRLVYVPPSGGWLDLGAQPGESSFHSLLSDGDALPLLVLPFVTVAALLLRTRRFGAGMLAGALSVGAAVVTIAPLILVHLFERYEAGFGADVFALGWLGTFFGGCALFLAEPVLFLLERRRIERANRPAPLPRATVLA